MQTKFDNDFSSSKQFHHSNPSSPKLGQSSDECWIKVTKGAKSKSLQPSTTPQQDKKSILKQNKFFIETSLTTKISKKQHASSVAVASVALKESKMESKLDDEKKKLRCHKRNQRRARQRAQKRSKSSSHPLSSQMISPKSHHPKSHHHKPSHNPNIIHITTAKAQVELEAAHLQEELSLLSLPQDILSSGIMTLLSPQDLLRFGQCSTACKSLADEPFLWKSALRTKFPTSRLASKENITEWKLAFKISSTCGLDQLRCSHTKDTFFEDVLGAGLDFTTNPKTKQVDYINTSQDLISKTAFFQHKIRSDVFGNNFKLFLPLYFSKDHFQRALPQIQKTVLRLCPEKKATYFDPVMILDVFPKLMNTFVVLLSDEGISASRRSFDGLMRFHRLFLALAERFPVIKVEALRRLRDFAAKEQCRIKSSCPSLGNLLPLMAIVDEKDFGWPQIASSYLMECFDRSVLWVCKKFPKLERTHDADGKVEPAEDGNERVSLTLEAMAVNTRLLMFHVYFLRIFCRHSTSDRCRLHDGLLGQNEEVGSSSNNNDDDDDVKDAASHPCQPLPHVIHQQNKADAMTFTHFRSHVSKILTVNTWNQFFRFIQMRPPATKEAMANLLRQAVKNSRRKRYHKAGMDFSRVQASGTSQILSKGQQFSASDDLKRVVFNDDWGFHETTKYLDATCFVYNDKKKLVHTVDYRNKVAFDGAIRHSGDMMRADGGKHTININLESLPESVMACVFVISAWKDATLLDIISPSVSFRDADAEDDADPLCVYDLDAQDKVSHLTAVVMCKLYRVKGGRWHVLAIGDAHRGAADNYAPLYPAVHKAL